MTMPGFGAEDSLGITPGHYYMPQRVGMVRCRADVLAQLAFRRPWPWQHCVPGCICVSPINCPCCGSIFDGAGFEERWR